jgi:hypothetical protein
MGDSSQQDGESKSNFGDRLKHPFHGLKAKMQNMGLQDTKVALLQKKYVYYRVNVSALG